MKTLGVIGGMGPAATAHFYNLFVNCFNVSTDQDHPDAIIFSMPSIPDRTAYILDRSKQSPLEHLRKAAKTLEGLGAGVIAVPCVTAHYFYDDMTKGLEIPVVHMLRETASLLSNNGVSKAGLLATAGTVASGIFQRELASRGIIAITPSPDMQNRLMDGLYGRLKAGKPMEMDVFYEVSNALRLEGGEVLVLGCTELSLVHRDNKLGEEYVDAMSVLARRAAEIISESMSTG